MWLEDCFGRVLRFIMYFKVPVLYQDTMKAKLFLSYSRLKSVGSHAGQCMYQGNKEAMRDSS